MSDSDSSTNIRKKSRLVKKKDLEDFRSHRASVETSMQPDEEAEKVQPKVASKHIFASDADALAAQLFGDVDLHVPVETVKGTEEGVAAQTSRPRSPSSMSGDSLDDFIYRDTRVPADDLVSEGASEYDEDILADIREVFGDLRVLQLREVSRKPKSQAPAVESAVPGDIALPALQGVDDAELYREAEWMWSTLHPDSGNKILWVRSCVMFLRDWLVRGFEMHFVRRHLVSAKYSTVLSEAQMEDIVVRLHDDWKELSAWHGKLASSLSRVREALENLAFESRPEILGLVDVLEISRAVTHWSSVLDVSFAEPGPDFRSVLLCVQSGVSNYLEPLRRALFPESEEGVPDSKSKLRRRDSSGPGFFGELAKDPSASSDGLVQLFSLLNCRPSDLGRVCVGQLGISGRGGFGGTGDISVAAQRAVAAFLSVDFAFRMYVRHELLRRASVYVIPVKTVSMTDPQYVHRRVLSRPLSRFIGSSDFLEYVELENRGEVRVCLAMTAGGVVAECKTNSDLGVTAEHVGKHIWACAQLHAMKQVELAGRPGELTDDHVRSCLVSDPILSSILQRLLAAHELTGESERGLMVQNVVREALHLVYSELYTEVKQDLIQQAEVVVARKAAEALVSKVGKRGWVVENLPSDVLDNLARSQREAIFRGMMGEYSVASIVPDSRGSLRAVVVNSLGEQVATEVLGFLLDRQMAGDQRRVDEVKKFSLILAEFKVAVIAISADFETFKIKAISKGMEELLRGCEDELVKRICKIVVVGDVHVAGVGAEQRGQGVARFLQNPLAESLRLWSDDPNKNVLLAIPFHPLQHLVPRAMLQAQFRFFISRSVADLGGLDVGRISRAPWRGTLIQFLPRMNALKAEKLLKSRNFARTSERGDQDSASSESEDVGPVEPSKKREQVLGDVLDSTTWMNIQSFLPRIPSSSAVISVLKGTRNGLKILNPSRSEDSLELGGLVLTRAEFQSALSTDDSEFMEVLGIPRDMWPLVTPLLQAVVGSPEVQSALCSNRLRLHQGVDLRLFVRDILDSGDAPEFLKDPEVDRDILETNTESYLKNFILEALHRPYRSKVEKLHSLTDEQILELQIGSETQSPFGFLKVHRLRVVKDDGRWGSLRFVDLSIDGSLKRSAGAVWTPNDRVLARIVGLEPSRHQAMLSVDPPSAAELREVSRLAPDTVVLRSDLAVYSSLGREISAVAGGKVGAGFSGPVRVRRVIRHDNYFPDLDHGLALVKLKNAEIGEVIFRPSKTKSNLLIAMVKIKEPVEVIRQDWLKVFQFSEEPSTRNPNKIVFKLKVSADGGKVEEFEELDQIKAVLIERYLRYLADFKQHTRFRPETLEQVRNLVNAEFMTDAKGHVAYHFALDERPESAGNGVLLWCAQGTKVKEEPVTISHRGFRLWNRGPFGTLNQLITWWKTEGFSKRSVFLAEWQANLSKMT